MVSKIAAADSRMRQNRGVSFLSRGSDNYDHHGLNKARRFQNKAAIDEQLEPEFIPQMPVYRYVVDLDEMTFYFENKVDADSFFQKETLRVKQNQMLACVADDDSWEMFFETMPSMEFREVAQWEMDC